MKREKYQNCKEQFLNALNSKNWNDVVVWSTELLMLNDTEARIWANRGSAFHKMGYQLDATLNYQKALQFEKDDEQQAILYSNIGAAYWDMYQEEKTREYLQKAIDLCPMAQTYLTLGNVYKHRGDLKKAIECYRTCVQLNADYADGHLVLAMALLKDKQLVEGFKEYEWRWKTAQLPARNLKCPHWKGQDLTNKSILVYGEQGLGDIIQFSRYATQLANRFPRAKIIVEGRPALKRLLETLPDVYAVINAGERLPLLDYAIPMMTLAGMLTPNTNAIIAHEPEFFLNRNAVETWADKFSQLPEGLRVGVCWSGMNRSQPEASAIDQVRSTTLQAFAPLAKIPGIMWVSLQQGPSAEQVKTPPVGMTIADFTEDMYDFYETCCAIENCDLVITVDTAVVHAAASLGKPTWLLSRWDGCWRWFGDRTDSPWYPSLKQFVQTEPRDWAGIMNNVAAELKKLVDHKNEPELDLTLAK